MASNSITLVSPFVHEFHKHQMSTYSMPGKRDTVSVPRGSPGLVEDREGNHTAHTRRQVLDGTNQNLLLLLHTMKKVLSLPQPEETRVSSSETLEDMNSFSARQEKR